MAVCRIQKTPNLASAVDPAEATLGLPFAAPGKKPNNAGPPIAVSDKSRAPAKCLITVAAALRSWNHALAEASAALSRPRLLALASTGVATECVSRPARFDLQFFFSGSALDG
jgi:hypothetical protein